MKKLIRKLAEMSAALFMVLALGACSSSNDTLAGNWVMWDNTDRVVNFETNGDLEGLPYSNAEYGDPIGYTLGSDTLTLRFTDNKSEVLTRTDSEQSALSNFDEYYLDDDTLVLRRRLYYKEDSQALADATAAKEEAQTAEQEEVDISELPGSVEGGQKYLATISVADYGDIVVELDEGIAPVTVQNFVDLANSGFYDGLTFHRIIEGFMIQGGDPLGNGTGGSDETIYGEFLANGFNNTLSHTRGVISMARSADYDSGSSQFFIVQEDTPSLDGQYAAFGNVVEGMEIVDAIAEAAKPTDGNGTIEKDDQPVITSITIEAE